MDEKSALNALWIMFHGLRDLMLGLPHGPRGGSINILS